MLVAKYLSEFCQKNAMTTVYHYIGGMTVRLIDEIGKNPSINLVTLRHEQGAGFAANAHARIKQKPFLALATSGPGATNLVTPIADCYFDHVPAIFITGQVNIHELNQNPHIRQKGFQETDIISICKPITKLAIQVTNADDFPSILTKAYKTATTAPFGPVVLDIPMNIQLQECSDVVEKITNLTNTFQVDNTLNSKIDDLLRSLTKAKRPLLLFGHGVSLANASKLCLEFAEKYSLPLVHTLHALDSSVTHLNYGLIGSYGNRYANKALIRSDFILVLGSRLDVRQLGANVSYFEENKEIYHVDINPAQFNATTKTAKGIVYDIKEFIEVLSKKNIKTSDFTTWLEELNVYKDKYPSLLELGFDDDTVNPNELVYKLSQKFDKIAGYTTDVGKNQMYVAQSLKLSQGQRILFSGGFGAMGFSLPASIGMAFATEKEVVCFTGDGGLQMNIQELQVVKHYNLPIKIVVFQNNALGMVQQFQEDYHESRLYGTVEDYSTPNFVELAKAYGLEAKKIEKSSEIDLAIEWLQSKKSACLLEVGIPQNVKLYPKVAFGNNLDNMYPYEEI